MASSALVEQVRSLVGPKIDAVESALVEYMDDCPAPLRDAAVNVFRSGGKRLRPILHLLCSDVLGYRGDRDVLYATAIEYIHVASLLHDDVIDEAVLRRGNPTLNQRYGNTLTVLVGDYLCMKAIALAIAAGDHDTLALLSSTTLELVQGEAVQESLSGSLDLDVDQYMQIVALKTGRLMATSCEMSALLVGDDTDTPRRQGLRDYGFQLGVAFQLTDDILDFSSDVATLGKPVLSDLREGTTTLPVIHALREGGPEAREMFSTVMEDGGFSRVEPQEAVDLVRKTGGLDAATAMAEQAAGRAREALDDFPAGPSLDALLFATEFAVSRTF